MDRPELAAFLRSRRERITAAEVGLPAGTRRRTPGLRREEVAQLAFISTEYYTRMEQANAPRPSGEVLAGIARALRLSDPERDHLHRLAGAPLAARTGPAREVRQSIRDLLDRLPNTAGMVLSATYEVLAWNALAAALLEDFSALPPRDRNLMRRAFLHRDGAYGMSDVTEFALASTRRLRATSARHPDDQQVHELVAELLAGSAEFARLWESHDVCTAPALKKTFNHPLVGAITVDCDGFDITDTDQQVVLYTAAPGSSSDEALRLLSVIGTQRMDVPG